MSHGTLAQTALPQVLLEEECNRSGHKLEWHKRAIYKAADRPVGFSARGPPRVSRLLTVVDNFTIMRGPKC